MKKRDEANDQPGPGGASSGGGAGDRSTRSDQPVESQRSAGDVSLSDQLEAARAERDANRELYLRTEAELQNYRRRAQKEIDDVRLYQSLALAREVLPPLDNLHRAIAVAESTKNVDELVQGVRMVARQIEDALARHEVTAIETQGRPFDPNVHQAIQQVASDEHPPMTVVKEVERGFVLKDRVVRPATVIVSSAAPAGETRPDGNTQSSGSRASEKADPSKSAE